MLRSTDSNNLMSITDTTTSEKGVNRSRSTQISLEFPRLSLPKYTNHSHRWRSHCQKNPMKRTLFRVAFFLGDTRTLLHRRNHRLSSIPFHPLTRRVYSAKRPYNLHNFKGVTPFSLISLIGGTYTSLEANHIPGQRVLSHFGAHIN